MQTARLRVLFVNRMAGMVRGGGETFDLEISNELVRQGCDVTFLAGYPLFSNPKPAPLDTSILSPERIRTIRTPFFPWFPWDKVKGGWRVRVWEFKQFEEKAAAWINRHANEFDVIQICELPYLVKRLKVQGSRSKEGEGSESAAFSLQPSTFNQGLRPKLVLRLTAPNAHDPWGGIQLADAVIASGTSIEKVRRKIRPDVHDVPNGVDLERFSSDVRSRKSEVIAQESDLGPLTSGVSPRTSDLRLPTSGFRASYGIPSEIPVLLYVARFQAFKNHRLLLEALAIVRKQASEVRLVLAGSGPMRQETETLARKLHVRDHLIFLGEVPFDQLPQVYAAADIKVISSEYESFCFAAIEAMASGLPVVTTDCGWVPKLIGDSLSPIQKQWAHGGDAPGRFEVEEDGRRIRETPGGLVVSRVEPHSLARALLTMIRDPELRHRCGAWNREKAVREHGWESSAKRLLGVYRDLLTTP